MKWKAKYPAKPEFGDKIIEKCFAFLPTRVGEHCVWLEFYYEVLVYRWGGDNIIGYFPTYPTPTRAMFRETLEYQIRVEV